MRAKAWTAVVIGALIALLAVTNPKPDDHKQAIRDAVFKDQPIVGLLGVGLLASTLATYDSYVLCSTMTYDGRRITFGILNKVFVDKGNLGIPRPETG